MTGQISDRYTYKGEKYDLVGLKGDSLPSPDDFGMRATATSTACWRGFVSHYELNEMLILVYMSVSIVGDKPSPINGVMPSESSEFTVKRHTLEDISEIDHTPEDLSKILEYLSEIDHILEDRSEIDLTLEDLSEILEKLSEIDQKNPYYDEDVVCSDHQYSDIGLIVPFTGSIRLAHDFISEYYVHMGFQKPSAYKTVIDFSLEEGHVMKAVDRSDDAAKIRGAFNKYYESEKETGDMEKIMDAFSLDMDFE